MCPGYSNNADKEQESWKVGKPSVQSIDRQSVTVCGFYTKELEHFQWTFRSIGGVLADGGEN